MNAKHTTLTNGKTERGLPRNCDFKMLKIDMEMGLTEIALLLLLKLAILEYVCSL